MYSKLEKCKKDKNLVALYSNQQECEKFSVGYIIEIYEEKLLMLNIGLYGEFDGYSAMYIENIFKIEIGSKYLHKIEALQFLNQNELHTFNPLEDIFKEIITVAQKFEYIVGISYGEFSEEVRGYVRELTDNNVSILQINEYAEEDGEVSLCTSIINKITINDVECKSLNKLFKLKHN